MTPNRKEGFAAIEGAAGQGRRAGLRHGALIAQRPRRLSAFRNHRVR